MKKATDFIAWALTHAKPNGAEPWEYLWGTTGTPITPSLIERKWQSHYCDRMTRAQYDKCVAAFTGKTATDCQGLLDAYLDVDVNADYCYKTWCTDKGTLEDLSDRPFVVGEAVFTTNAKGNMGHVGFVCGFDGDTEPLAVEARGIAYGVVITRLCKRGWTHRGLVTKMLDYTDGGDTVADTEHTIFVVTTPMQRGDTFRAMQEALNLSGYTDADGDPLTEDGKWGKRSQQAFDRLIAAHTAIAVEDKPTELPVTVTYGDTVYEGSVAHRD